METCTTCRNPLASGAKFCGLCGQQVQAPIEAPAPTIPPAQPVAAPPIHRSSVQVPVGILTAGAAALVLVLGLVAGLFLLGGNDEPPTSAAAGPPTESATTTTSADPTASPSAPAATFTCWDGSSRASASECRPVQGEAGMRWAFPALDQQFDQCEPARVYDGKVRAFGCDTTTAGGSTARVTYSEWSTYEAGDEHYREKYGAPDRTGTQFENWGAAFIEDDFQTSRIFKTRLPFSVTVQAAERATVGNVLGGLEFRADDDIAPYLR